MQRVRAVYNKKRKGDYQMKKKQYKIIKTDLFKEQEKNLPKRVKEELSRTLKSIAKNPTEAPDTMGLFNPPSAEELKQWMSRGKPETIDLVLEYLTNKGCLNDIGKKLAKDFWERYIKKPNQKSTKLLKK